MQRLADVMLALLQWTLVALGLAIVIGSVVSYWQTRAFLASRPELTEDSGAYADTFYYAPSPLGVLVFGVTLGLIAVGLGATLFYLRRLYLARRGI